jgi:hypothetical protein
LTARDPTLLKAKAENSSKNSERFGGGTTEVPFFVHLKCKFFEFRMRSGFCGCNRGQKNTPRFKRTAHAFPIDQLVKNTRRIRPITLFVDCEAIRNFVVQPLFSTGSHHRPAQFIALSSSKDKLASGY